MSNNTDPYITREEFDQRLQQAFNEQTAKIGQMLVDRKTTTSKKETKKKEKRPVAKHWSVNFNKTTGVIKGQFETESGRTCYLSPANNREQAMEEAKIMSSHFGKNAGSLTPLPNTPRYQILVEEALKFMCSRPKQYKSKKKQTVKTQ